MMPPRWVDEHGRELPTRPCQECGRVIPIHGRWWPIADGVRHDPSEVFDYVTWCGHRQEVILGPRVDGWFDGIPVVERGDVTPSPVLRHILGVGNLRDR